MITLLKYISIIGTYRGNVREEFMKKYNEDRKYCSKCGGEKYSKTFVGYIFDNSNPDSYKDENQCVCSSCGDVHKFHNRVGMPFVTFMVCPKCSNKRCPKNQDDRFKCTNSNEVGRVGELES